ncbi:hypothetical protein A9200_10840 [Maribacter hydrothermalis]|uniref:DUF4347 domain-containing protein n=2 Tax=Maribacter hydrothermalis TaxID=1836467 RepID=A0A1B7YYZ1_9FLAO|nr:hypothetical protein BTR34_01675 [Maribacter hydrothermalis]OBR35689.1 hypothetical protein A9200_10840 [Maribacter hydrothermalis]
MLGSKKPFSQQSGAALAPPSKKEVVQESIVFIAGFDEGDNTYYGNAKQYFEKQRMSVVDSLFAIDEIVKYLNSAGENQIRYNEIHIVSHSNAWLGMSLKTTRTGERITERSLQDAISENKMETICDGVTSDSKIIFHSCGLGENQPLLQELKNTFKADEVVASPYFNVFGGKYADHYLAKPYYGYYPTAESLGPAHLSKEFKQAYPTVNIDWFTALKTRQESSFGKAYSFKFNIPVDWEFTFDSEDDIPTLEDKEAIMDWISESPEMAEVLFKLNIPIESFRWRSTIKENKLIIKGKTTVLCILAPILKSNDANEYQSTNIQDPLLYQIL